MNAPKIVEQKSLVERGLCALEEFLSKAVTVRARDGVTLEAWEDSDICGAIRMDQLRDVVRFARRALDRQECEIEIAKIRAYAALAPLDPMDHIRVLAESLTVESDDNGKTEQNPPAST